MSPTAPPPTGSRVFRKMRKDLSEGRTEQLRGRSEPRTRALDPGSWDPAASESSSQDSEGRTRGREIRAEVIMMEGAFPRAAARHADRSDVPDTGARS